MFFELIGFSQNSINNNWKVKISQKSCQVKEVRQKRIHVVWVYYTCYMKFENKAKVGCSVYGCTVRLKENKGN